MAEIVKQGHINWDKTVKVKLVEEQINGMDK